MEIDKVTNPEKIETIIDSQPLHPKVKTWAIEAYLGGYLKTSEISDVDFLSNKYQTFLTAIHEIGHAAVVRSLGWSVSLVSVIPDGNVLGITKYFINSSSREDSITGQIAASLGGEAGEDLAGLTDHSGCGSDFAKARFLEKAMLRIGKNTSGLRSWARSTVFSQASNIKSQALHLMNAGTMV